MLALIFSTALLVAGGAQPLDAETEVLSRQLRAKDEILLSAVHTGDKKAWESMTTPDFAYVEEGVIQHRSEFLQALAPDGAEPLLIRDYAVHRIGDTAIVIHEDEVPSHPLLASRPNGRYLMTETWQRVAHDWKLRLVHIEAIRTDPPRLALTHAQIDELVGTYRTTASSFVIRRDGERILGARPGRPEVELMAETRDVLFVPGDTRLRRVFLRDAAGEVTAFAHRDENSDVIYTRTRPGGSQ